MAKTIRYTPDKEMRLLYASIGEKSAAKLDNGQMGEAKFGATFGIEHEADFKAIVDIMVGGIKSELGSFTSPADYYLACTGGKTAGKRAIQAAEFKCGKPGLAEDVKFKIMEAANKRAELYAPFVGILVANSKFDVEMAYLKEGKVVDVQDNEAAKKEADKTYFYRGAYVVPAIGFKAFRRKTIEAKDGVTAYLQNCLYVRRGEKIGGAGPANSEVFGKFAGYSSFDPMAMAPDGDEQSEF